MPATCQDFWKFSVQMHFILFFSDWRKFVYFSSSILFLLLAPAPMFLFYKVFGPAGIARQIVFKFSPVCFSFQQNSQNYLTLWQSGNFSSKGEKCRSWARETTVTVIGLTLTIPSVIEVRGALSVCCFIKFNLIPQPTLNQLFSFVLSLVCFSFSSTWILNLQVLRVRIKL